MEFKKEELFTIPNILTYIRLICVPVFVWLMAEFCVHKTDVYMWASFGVFLFAEITDICDGNIARNFNQISDIGKVLDPIADKLLQCVAVLMLCISANIHWAFAIVIIVKEVYMGVTSKYWMRASKRQVEQKSIKIGKAGATIYFIGILLSFFTLKNDIVKWIDFAILVIASVLAVAAAAVYTAIYAKQLKALKESGILDTLDRYGRPLPKVEEIGERTDRDDVQSESEQVEDTQER